MSTAKWWHTDKGVGLRWEEKDMQWNERGGGRFNRAQASGYWKLLLRNTVVARWGIMCIEHTCSSYLSGTCAGFFAAVFRNPTITKYKLFRVFIYLLQLSINNACMPEQNHNTDPRLGPDMCTMFPRYLLSLAVGKLPYFLKRPDSGNRDAQRVEVLDDGRGTILQWIHELTDHVGALCHLFVKIFFAILRR